MLLLAVPFQLSASNVSFLKYAVITGFSDADVQQLVSEYKQVLKNNKTGEVRKWINSESGNGGEIKVMKQYRKNGNHCKRLMFKNYTDKQSATSYYNFCLVDQLWQLSS